MNKLVGYYAVFFYVCVSKDCLPISISVNYLAPRLFVLVLSENHFLGFLRLFQKKLTHPFIERGDLPGSARLPRNI